MANCHKVIPPEYEVGVKVLRKLINSKILSIEAHVGKQLKLMLVVVKDEAALGISLIDNLIAMILYNIVFIMLSCHPYLQTQPPLFLTISSTTFLTTSESDSCLPELAVLASSSRLLCCFSSSQVKTTSSATT